MSKDQGLTESQAHALKMAFSGAPVRPVEGAVSTIDAQLHEMHNRVYEALAPFEHHESLLGRNGHHVRQKIAGAVRNLFVSMLPPEVQAAFPPEHPEFYTFKIVED